MMTMTTAQRLDRMTRVLGLEFTAISHTERLVSALTGTLAMYLLVRLEGGVAGDAGAALLVASMGASAVLLFAVPHGKLSQPWAVLAGHGVSATLGVAIARLVPDVALAASLAVGAAIGAMHYLRAIHPPGGATALAAVIGGPHLKALGFQYVLTPVLFNAAVMVGLAVALNAAFAWRRYPQGLLREAPAAPEPLALNHADFVAALRRLGTFVDISEDDFARIAQLVREEANTRRIQPADIKLGHYYSNAATGDDWSVRRVVDIGPGTGDSLIWRAVAGHGRNEQGLSTRAEFAQWATCEVLRAQNARVRQP